MIQYELYKIWRSRLLWGFLAVFILINAVRIVQLSEQFRVNKEMNEARTQLYTEVRGTWNKDKLQFVIEKQHDLETQVMSGNYSTEPDQPDTYSGYVFGDYSLFTEIYTEMDYMYHYEANNKKVLSDIQNNIAFFTERGNTTDAKRSAAALSHYQNRKISAYYRTAGAEQWIHYSFSSLLILISVILCISPCFAKEHETKMDALLQTVRYGQTRLCLAKIIAALISTFGIVLTFSGTDGMCFLIGFSLDCLHNPIYSIASMQDSPFSCSIGIYLIFLYVCKLLSAILFAMLVLFFSCMTKDEMRTAICSVVAIVLAMIIGGSWNPLSLFTMNQYASDFQCVSLFGVYLLKPIGMLLAVILELFAAMIAILLLHRKRGSYDRL